MDQSLPSLPATSNINYINMWKPSIPQLLTSHAAGLVAFMHSRGFALRQPFASHLDGELLDHIWANLHHTQWLLVKQIPFIKEAWISDHLAIG